jgi:signal transduction histidine kinase
MRTSLWPNGLIGRVSIVLFAAIVLEVLGSTFVFEQAELVSSDDAQAKQIAEHIDAVARVLGVTDRAQRAAVVTTLSDASMRFDWHETPDRTPVPKSDDRAQMLRKKMLANAPSLTRRDLALWADSTDPGHALEGRLTLDDKSTLRFRAAALDSALPSLYGQLGSVLVLSSCVLLAALLVVRTLAAPLRMLVQATDAIGHGPPIHLDEEGPREIRRVARAFNAMQSRISKLVKDRTEALAAVSHDLRTPIGRMRLRTGFLSSPEDQAAFETDLGEMEAMLNDLLAYLGGETDPEKPKPTNIAAMLQTLADAATDGGHEVTYDGPDHLAIEIRALGLKRAFSNVVNNAIAYGGGARIVLAETGREIIVTFDDDGPGIPDAELAAVFAPFYRGDSSRNRAKGGMGLGLAITREAVWRHGGTIELANRTEGGLRVIVTLPRI